MSIEAMNWALSQQTGERSSAAKSVLLILANRANHEGTCFPGIKGIAEQTSLSERSVIRQVKKLTELGLLSVVHRGGTGEGRKSNVYQLHLKAKCHSGTKGQSDNVSRQCDNLSKQSDNVSPEPKDNPKKKPKSAARKRVPKSFALTDSLKKYAGDKGMSPSDLEDEFEKFCNCEFKTPKKDWAATWRTWCINWKRYRKDETDRRGNTKSFDELLADNERRIEQGGSGLDSDGKVIRQSVLP